MTVIASLNINSVPVLIGDILISNEITGNNPLTIPTIGSVSKCSLSGSGFEPVNLRQKISILGDNIAIAWAGSMVHAATVIAELNNLNKAKQFNEFTFGTHLAKMKGEGELKKISLIAYIARDGHAKFVPHNVQLIDTDKNGLVYFAGGCSNYLDGLVKAERLPAISYGQMNSLDIAASFLLSFNSTYLHKEIIDQENLNFLYGGGYEGVVFVGSKFTKIGDVTYVFWGDGDGQGEKKLGLRRIIKQFYHDGILCFFVIEPTETDKMDVVNCYKIAVPPVHRYVRDEEYRNIEFPGINSTYTCHNISIKISDEKSTLVPLLQCEKVISKRWMKIDLDGGIFKFDLSEDFWTMVNEARETAKRL